MLLHHFRKRKVSSVPVSIPPITAAPISRWLEAPAPVESTFFVNHQIHSASLFTLQQSK
ncbi:hypothetical protein HMPREF1144_6219 [Klebsiella sp. OBRC7]|nr:hypothetical protein HMPREF1144_6219 [Klebsiella sp. OBRC7]